MIISRYPPTVSQYEPFCQTDGAVKVNELFAYLRLKNAAEAIDFYKQAFGTTEKSRLAEPSGRIGHSIEEVSPEQVQLRFTAMMTGG